MTNEEHIINEAEAILGEAKEAMSKAQSAEHIAFMPHLTRMARELVAQSGKAHRAVHMLMILDDEEADASMAANPLNIQGNPDDRMVAQLRLFHSWNTEADAIKTIQSPESLVLSYEAAKVRKFAIFLTSRSGMSAYFINGKLTVGRLVLGDEVTVHHVDITRDDTTPERFFEQCALAPIECELVTALMAFMEGGRLMERETPALYRVLAKRVHERRERLGEDD